MVMATTRGRSGCSPRVLVQGFECLSGHSGSQHNFIFTYTYTTTLGLLLTLWCLFFTLRHILGRSGHDLMLAGLAAGLALLCKQEFGVACYIGLAFALGLEAAAQTLGANAAPWHQCVRSGRSFMRIGLRMVLLEAFARFYPAR